VLSPVSRLWICQPDGLRVYSYPQHQKDDVMCPGVVCAAVVLNWLRVLHLLIDATSWTLYTVEPATSTVESRCNKQSTLITNKWIAKNYYSSINQFSSCSASYVSLCECFCFHYKQSYCYVTNWSQPVVNIDNKQMKHSERTVAISINIEWFIVCAASRPSKIS